MQLRAEARRFREELQAAHEETEVLEREHAIAKSELQALREQASRDTPPGSPAPTLSQTPSRLDASPQNRVRRLQRRASFVESDSMEQQLAGLSAEERADVLARSVQALHRKLDLQNEAWRVKLRGAERQAIQATAELRVKQLEAADSVAAAQVSGRGGRGVPHCVDFPPFFRARLVSLSNAPPLMLPPPPCSAFIRGWRRRRQSASAQSSGRSERSKALWRKALQATPTHL